MENFEAEFKALLAQDQSLAVPIAIAKHIANVSLNELKGVNALYPDFRDKIVQLISNMKNLGKSIYLVEGFRTAKRQNDLFIQLPSVTKAKGLQSYHNFGCAADFAFTDWNYTPPSFSWWDTLQKEAEKLGLISGNGWKPFQDKPHVEWHPKFSWDILESYFKV